MGDKTTLFCVVDYDGISEVDPQKAVCDAVESASEDEEFNYEKVETELEDELEQPEGTMKKATVRAEVHEMEIDEEERVEKAVSSTMNSQTSEDAVYGISVTIH